MAEQDILRLGSLYGGISQQPPHLRFTNQVEDSVNAAPSVVNGLNKRQGSLFVATVTGSGGSALLSDGNYRMHPINRDENEQYLVIFGRGSTGGTVLKVLGLGNGNAPSLGLLATVNITTAAQTYLDSGSPTGDDIRMVTIADYTIVVNTKVATGYSTSGSYSPAATYADYDAMVAASLTNGSIYKCTNDTTTQPRGYYKYNSSATNILDKYQRVAAPSQVKAVIDKTKMPLKLVRTTASSGAGVPAVFSLDVITWNDRLSGDDATNPLPSIIEKQKPITDISYHRDRLVLAAGENVVLSQAGDIFNFFLDNAYNIVDSDPIDRVLSSEEVTVIEYIVPFRSSLSLFTRAGRQFEMNSTETLTPTTASINPTTRYETLRVRPTLAGETLFFAGRLKSSAAIFEYMYDDVSVSLTAADVTKHVPTLIPLTVRSMASSPNDGAVFVLPKGGNRIFVHFYYWRGNNKDQSAWTKYDFDASYLIHDIAAIRSNVYMLVAVGSEFVVERFGIGPTPVGQPVDDASDLTVAAGSPPPPIPTVARIMGLRNGNAPGGLAQADYWMHDGDMLTANITNVGSTVNNWQNADVPESWYPLGSGEFTADILYTDELVSTDATYSNDVVFRSTSGTLRGSRARTIDSVFQYHEYVLTGSLSQETRLRDGTVYTGTISGVLAVTANYFRWGGGSYLPTYPLKIGAFYVGGPYTSSNIPGPVWTSSRTGSNTYSMTSFVSNLSENQVAYGQYGQSQTRKYTRVVTVNYIPPAGSLIANPPITLWEGD